MNLHTEEQLRVKRNAIEMAALVFAMQYEEGQFNNNEQRLYHAIENLNSLVVELKRG